MIYQYKTFYQLLNKSHKTLLDFRNCKNLFCITKFRVGRHFAALSRVDIQVHLNVEKKILLHTTTCLNIPVTKDGQGNGCFETSLIRTSKLQPVLIIGTWSCFHLSQEFWGRISGSFTCDNFFIVMKWFAELLESVK